MRIIAGEARGRRIFTPDGMDTRPTTDRVRESLFGILTPRLPDARVLDLFSGSGALSLEAVSRGAQLAVACDKAMQAIKAIQRNVEITGFSDRIQILKSDWVSALKRLSGRQFDIVFLDPPYKQLDWYSQAACMLRDGNMIAPDGILVMEHLMRDEITLPEGFIRFDQRRYGDTAVDLVRREEEDDAGHLSGQL